MQLPWHAFWQPQCRRKLQTELASGRAVQNCSLNVSSNSDICSAATPVTQDGDLAAICKIGRIAADRRWVVVRSHRAPWEHCRSQEGLQGRRGRSQVLNKRSEVAVETGRHNIAANAPYGRCGYAKSALPSQWRRLRRICVKYGKISVILSRHQ